MISRVAESCYWLHRYVERAESIARLLRVNRSFLLDVSVPELERWQPVVVVSGEQQRFSERHAELQDDGEVVQHYLSWDEQCPVSIASSIYWARENARTIREVISLDMWEAVNVLWHWLKRGQGRRLFAKDRDAFYKYVKDAVALFQGVCHNTMLHEQPFDFMRLGMLLERASQTARTMDVKYHLLGPTSGTEAETPVEAAQWVALLRSCSAEDSYFRRYQNALSGPDVADFLLKEENFPRAVYHCLHRARNFLNRIATSTATGRQTSLLLLSELVQSLGQKTIANILNSGLHAELTRIIDRCAAICNAIHADYFNPSLGKDHSEVGALAPPATVSPQPVQHKDHPE